ncbi:acetylxylan esterase [Deinococcus aestuarii]|uniref:acetylxylan esterase n=1 Tax=Deinococcus aestuarii TaxID=2774531 RepID=UPI001C0B95B3
MALFDLPESELRTYCPEREEPPGFGAFWTRTLEEARAAAPGPRFEAADVPLATVEAFDVTFGGAGGSPVRAWLVLPRRREDRVPCVVEFLGYGGGRGSAHEWLLYASAGYAHLVMDTRGQGGGWRRGDTPDPGAGGEPHSPGFLTQGIRDPHTSYYRRLYTDAVRAVETALAHPGIDPSCVAVTGTSQGGGLALVAAGLVPGVAACLPDVPFLCHFERAIRLTDSPPYAEVAGYLRVHRDALPEVRRTLAHLDGMHFAARARARALFSVALMDDVCPPSTVYAAYNHYAGEKRIVEFPFNRHEGGQGHHDLEKLAFLQDVFGQGGRPA